MSQLSTATICITSHVFQGNAYIAKSPMLGSMEDILRANGIHFMHAESHISSADLDTVQHDEAPLMDRVQV